MTTLLTPAPDGFSAPIAGDVHIKRLSEDSMSAWDDYVLMQQAATFFHRAGWKTVIERAFGHRTHFLYAERAGRVVGVLPLAEVKSLLFGHSIASLPFCVYGGIVADDQAAFDALDQAAQELGAQSGAAYLEYRSIEASHDNWPQKKLYVTFRKEILPEEEANMNAIPRKQRAMVRKGIAAGLQSEIDEGTDRFFHAYSISVHRLGTPVFSRKYFRTLKEVFGKDCEQMIITKDGRTVAAVMSFYFRDEVLPYYGGGTPEARDLAANDFMYWELMRRACARGLRVFDFGRSKEGTGAYSFKKNWGFAPTPLQYEYQLYSAQTVPDTNPLNPKYQLMIKTWQRMPVWLANAIGPFIVRNLG